MITDEGASFLSDLKRYETKHESYISLLNQLFDGKGDKMTLAKNVERPVPRNATSLSIGVQQKSFCDAIFGLSETLWLDNGFGERFIFSAARPYRYLYAETYININCYHTSIQMCGQYCILAPSLKIKRSDCTYFNVVSVFICKHKLQYASRKHTLLFCTNNSKLQVSPKWTTVFSLKVTKFSYL